MLRKIVVLTAAAAAVALVLVLPASAAPIQVSGEQTLIDEATQTYSMSGSLVGLWYTDSFDCHAIPGGAETTWPCSGTEHFVGCLDTSGDGSCSQEAEGMLEFAFTYTGTPVGNGRCHHVIVGSDGAFTGATGQLTFRDRLGECGIVTTTYMGHIDLP
jgi:hypothetical protein